jgi:alkylation response protein AidB-like acyl-CoA dehydrogenase
MRFGLSSEQEMLADSVRRFLAAEVPLDTVRAIAEGGDDAAVRSGLADLGVHALLVPEAAGGLGLSCLDAVVVAECLGAAVTPTSWLASAVLFPVAIRHAGLAGDEECAALLGAVAAGETRIGAALVEAVAPRRDAGIRCEDGRLSGRALYALGASAEHWLVADAARQLHLVAGDAEGLTVRPLPTVDRTRETAELELSNVPARRLSDTPDVFEAVLDAGRVMLAADTLGAARYMLDAAVAYAKEREQFGRPIGSFQAVKHMCAEMAAELEPCRSLVWYAGHALDAVPEESRLVACHAKALLAEVGSFVAKTATEVHGGMGFTDLLGLHYWFKRIGANRQLLGAPELVREEAARLQGLAA